MQLGNEPLSADTLAEHALPRILNAPGNRKLIAIAGPPGSGKSTVSERLCAGLRAQGRSADVVPMDGFHLDNRVLEPRGLLPRKGAPDSFDAAGFAAIVARIARGEDVVFPVFDRSRDIAIAGAGFLPASVEFVLFEGNYLLLRDAPWAELAAHWGYTVMIDPGQQVLASRLLQRWLEAGLPEAQARAKCDLNDLPNAVLTRDRSRPADLTLGGS